MTSFKETFGFERSQVGLHNWRERPYSAWAFQNGSEIVDTAIVKASPSGSSKNKPTSDELLTAVVGDGDETVLSFLEGSETESFLVSKSSQVQLEWHAAHALPSQPHILFSVSKSITGLLAGILQDQGLFDPQKTVGHYLPETENCGYGDCSLQHLLDMRVSLDFIEDYLDTTGGFARYRRATGWNPPEPGHTSEGLATFLCSLAKGDGPHGGDFRYLSPNTDLLGLVLERIAGMAFADLMSEHLWQPLGAATDAIVMQDGKGAPRTAGGIHVTGQDLLRLGELILNGGAAGSTQVISERWLADMQNNGDADAWARGDFVAMMGPGRYRNKWYQLGPDSRQISALGIHGQGLFVDPKTEVVIVKLSSQAIPFDEELEKRTLEIFGQLSAIV